MYRIGGRQGDVNASLQGASNGIPPLMYRSSNRIWQTHNGTVSGGQFDWGGRLLKSNGGAQRYPQLGWKPSAECKGKRVFDCETDKSSRDESRA